MREANGVVNGIVKDVDDPDKLGRVRLEFPWLDPSYRTDWVRIAAPMAGNSRGAFFMPEKEDEVLVAFEKGNFDHPFIVGFLWNGEHEPPHDGIDFDPRVRRLRTVSGHVLEFDDRPGSERILVQTKDRDGQAKDGHQIELKDTPPGHIKIRTRGGQEVKLSDLPPTVAIETASGNHITISDVSQSITIEAKLGKIIIGPAGISIEAPAGLINVVAPIVQFSGVVMAPTLIATSVVSSAYTPAPGNTFGL